jgi:hypothetical protein
MRRAGLALVPCLIVLAGCGTSSGGLSASSTCAQFMAAEEAERIQITAQLYESTHVHSSLGATNALIETEYTCHDEPTTKLGSVPVLSRSE